MIISSPQKTTLNSANDSFRMNIGLVCGMDGEKFLVLDSNQKQAELAASCVSRPLIGDSVLIAQNYDVCWILAVLATSGERVINLSATELIANSDKISIAANNLTTKGAKWHAIHDSVQLTARHLCGQISVVEWLSMRFTSYIETIASKCRLSFKQVSEHDSTTAANYELRTEDTMLLSCKTGVISAQGLMKLDGTQIHVG